MADMYPLLPPLRRPPGSAPRSRTGPTFNRYKAAHDPGAYLFDYLLKMSAWREQEGHSSGLYASYESLILEQGQPFRSHPLPGAVQAGAMKYCFANALALVRAIPRLKYAEGFAVHPDVGMAVQHAWAVDADERVWDRTWPEPERCAYYGMTFESWEIERFDALGPDYLGILASEYLLGFPLLNTGRLFPEDVDALADRRGRRSRPRE